MPTLNEKIKASLTPAVGLPSDAVYEALTAGVGPNRSLQYSQKEGITQRTGEQNTEENVFSRFALDKNNNIYSPDLIQYRIDHADEYQNEMQALSAAVSGTMRKYYDKSSWLGSVVDLGMAVKQGLQNWGINTFNAARTAPDTIEAIQAGLEMEDTRDILNDKEFENVKEALYSRFYSITNPNNYKEGNPVPTSEEAYDELAVANIDLMKGTDGKPLTENEKNAVRAFQRNILARRQIERNQMAKAFFETYDNQALAGSWVNVGMGATTTLAIGNFAGDVLASAALFGVVGRAPIALSQKSTVALAGRSMALAGKGAKLGTQAARWRNAALTAHRLGNGARAATYLQRANVLRRNSNYLLGAGTFISKNLPKVTALGSMAGGAGVFSQAFLTQANDTATSLLSKGASWDKAFGAGVASGFAEGGIETFVGFKFLNKFLTRNRSFTNFLNKAVLPEGFEEATQNLATEVITSIVGMNDKSYADIAAETFYAFLGGMLGGAVMAGGSYSIFADGHDVRMMRAKAAEVAAKKTPIVMQSALKEYGEQKKAIRSKYVAESKASRLRAKEERAAYRKKVFAEFEKAKDKRIDWEVEAEAKYDAWEKEQRKKWDAEEQARQKKMRDELAAKNGEWMQRQRLEDEAEAELEKNAASGEQARISFNMLEEKVLDELQEDYEERVKQVNPNITLEQIESGWNGIRAMLLQEGYTGEFSKAVENSIDNMISFAQRSEENIKASLDNLTNKLGLTREEASAAARLTSKDAIEKYNAELDLVEEKVIEQFRLAGAEAEGKVFATIFRNQIGYLPAVVTNKDGQPMSPLDFYEAVKPRIINIQNAMMQNERIPNINNVMLEASEQNDSENNYLDGNGDFDYNAAYQHYAGLWNLITNYNSIKDENSKQQALIDINLALFNSYNYTNDVDFIKDYIVTRAGKEGAILHEIGLDVGYGDDNDAFAILALMRQKGLSFAFSAHVAGFVQGDVQANKSDEEFDEQYYALLDKMYPALSDEDIMWLNRIAKMKFNKKESVGKAPKYRDMTVTQDGTTIYDEQDTEAPESVQAKKDIIEEEGELLEDTSSQDNKPVTWTKANQEQMDKAYEAETDQTSNYIAPNALYSREGRVILVVNGKAQGEFLHEAGHYLITEFLLSNMELANIVGDKGYGPVNQLLIQLYDAVKGNGGIRLNAISKQETILDALMDFIRTDGHTGDERVDAIISEMRDLLNEQIIHPEGSRYEQMSAEQKANLRECIRNLFKPTAGLDMLNSRIDLENAINTKSIDEAAKIGLKYMDKYALPNMDTIRFALENPMSDYMTKRAALVNLQQEINLQAISLLMSNTDQVQIKHSKVGFSKDESEDIQEGQVFKFAEQKPQAATTVAPAERKARAGMSWQERGEASWDALKKFLKHPFSNSAKAVQKNTRYFRSSLVELARNVTPELGNKIQETMNEKNKLVKKYREPAKQFIDLLDKQDELGDPIMQAEYDEGFVDNLNNMRIQEAREWLVNRAHPLLKESFATAFDGMITSLNEMKMLMKKLEVRPNGEGWIADGAFFPRSIDDYEKFSEEYLKLLPESLYAKVIDTSKLDEKQKQMNKAQATYHLQRVFNDMVRQGSSESRVGFLQQRVIKEVTPEMRSYYKDPIDAYLDYVEDATITIMTRELVGASHEELEKKDQNAAMSSLLQAGKIFKVLHDKGFLAPGRFDVTGLSEEQISEIKQQEENLREFDKALRAFITRSKEQGALFKFTNDLLTVTMLGHFSTALSQGQEMITTAWLFGMKNTAAAAADVAKGKAKITVQDLGIDELEEAYRAVTAGAGKIIVDGALKLSGFKAADVYFKNVAINAIYNFFENALNDPQGADFKRAKEIIQTSFEGLDNYERRVVQLMDDLKNKRVTDDIKYLMYDVFANQQPLNSANISYGYNAASPLGRLCLFKFNTVAYKQLNAICGRIKESWTEVGADGKVHLTPKRGFVEALRLLMFCAMIGIPLDTIKNLLNGNAEFHPGKSFMFSVAQCFMINEYDAATLTKEGLGTLLADKASAPLTVFNWASQDIRDASKGNFTFKTAKGIPVFGRGVHRILYALNESANESSGYEDFGFNDGSEYWWG